MTKLWGGNYDAAPDAVFWEFNRSFPFDRRLVREEIAASRAWVRALGRCGAFPRPMPRPSSADSPRCSRSSRPTRTISSWTSRTSTASSRSGSREVVGELAGQAHLGRSRNEQTVTALRLFARGAIDALARGLATLVAALVEKGRSGADAVMPGYTHTRAAEPITFGFWAAAHAWGLVRDRERLRDARVRVDVMPLGSGALAGAVAPARPRRDGAGPRLRGGLPRRARRGDGPRLRRRARLRAAPRSRPTSRASART